jgi:hypothetical protein
MVVPMKEQTMVSDFVQRHTSKLGGWKRGDGGSRGVSILSSKGNLPSCIFASNSVLIVCGRVQAMTEVRVMFVRISEYKCADLCYRRTSIVLQETYTTSFNLSTCVCHPLYSQFSLRVVFAFASFPRPSSSRSQITCISTDNLDSFVLGHNHFR